MTDDDEGPSQTKTIILDIYIYIYIYIYIISYILRRNIKKTNLISASLKNLYPHLP